MSQSNQPQGVQYAQAGELTPEQARQMIMNAQNPHPGVSPGIGHENDWVGPLFAEEYAKGYAETTLGLAAGELGPEATMAARGAVNSGRFLTATEALGGAAYGFNEGFNFGVPGGGQGNPFATPRVGSTAFIVGRAVGRAAGVGAGIVTRSGETIAQFLTGLRF